MLAAVADGPTYSSTCQSAPRRTLAIVKLTKRGARVQPQPPKALCNPDTTPARSKRTRKRAPPQGEVTPTAPHTPHRETVAPRGAPSGQTAECCRDPTGHPADRLDTCWGAIKRRVAT